MPNHSQTAPILLVDDSREDLYLAQLLLEQAAVERPIVTKADGEEAIGFLLAALNDPNVDLPCCVFCDIRMPKVNGFGVLEWTRAQEKLAETPFAILTGGDLLEDRERADALGADHFLVKFPGPQVFKEIIDQACGR